MSDLFHHDVPRLDAGHLDPNLRIAIDGGEHAHPGDGVATRRNDRHLVTDAAEPVRNRDCGPSPPPTPTAK